MSGNRLLEMQMYEPPDAARLLGVPVLAMKQWRHGRGLAGQILSVGGHQDHKFLTWGDFVTAALYAEFRAARRTKFNDLAALAPVLGALSEAAGSRWPFARHETWATLQGDIFNAQPEPAADTGARAPLLVQKRLGKLTWTAPARRFVSKLAFEDGVAAAYRPAGPASPVVIDPQRRFGRPSLRGLVSVGMLWSCYDAGDALDEIHHAYELGSHGISMDALAAAIAWCEQKRLAAGPDWADA